MIWLTIAVIILSLVVASLVNQAHEQHQLLRRTDLSAYTDRERFFRLARALRDAQVIEIYRDNSTGEDRYETGDKIRRIG